MEDARVTKPPTTSHIWFYGNDDQKRYEEEEAKNITSLWAITSVSYFTDELSRFIDSQCHNSPSIHPSIQPFIQVFYRQTNLYLKSKNTDQKTETKSNEMK